MNVEIEINEGDVLILNGKRWKVEEDLGGLDAHKMTWEPDVGELQIFHKDRIEELMKYSGQVRLIRNDYLDVYEI